MLKLIPLGGLGEIGLNTMALAYHDTMFVIDAGLMFPEDYMLGVDYVIPDMSYLKAHASQIAGIVLTHAHEDHIGALPYLIKEVPAPVFGTPFTLGMVRHKLQAHDLLDAVRLHAVSPRETLKIGPFGVEFIRVSHSVVDGVALAIDTPYGRIIHTGDFKFGHTCVKGMDTDVNRFAQLGDEGVLALLSDSTNVESIGHTPSDCDLGEALAGICRRCPGRIIIALFASNVGRIQQIVDIADSTNRKILFNGHSIEVSVNIARQLEYLCIPEHMEIDIDQIDDYLDDEVIIVTTGSQGEPMSALARMSAGTHRQIKIKSDDTVILSSKFIPGNEKAITNIINNLFRCGANVIYEKIANIHVSGHAHQEELKTMIRLTRPNYFIPIHGEYRHLVQHARLAEQQGIGKENVFLAQNGQTILVSPDGMHLGESVSTGRLLIDGKGVGDVGRSVLKERRVLSEEGMVMVNMAFDEETGIIIYGPDVVSKGFVFETETGHLIDDAQCVILEIVEDVPPELPNRVEIIRTRIQAALRQYFFFTIGRRPVIMPFVVEV
ncbi:MAG: ribonuclease J [Desulfatitalea sp.]|nr:ribonuclease J [Desulfatitalea sp.]NNK01568.1 ribonuclease J [Desulfatitalea sp.]